MRCVVKSPFNVCIEEKVWLSHPPVPFLATAVGSKGWKLCRRSRASVRWPFPFSTRSVAGLCFSRPPPKLQANRCSLQLARAYASPKNVVVMTAQPSRANMRVVRTRQDTRQKDLGVRGAKWHDTQGHSFVKMFGSRTLRKQSSGADCERQPHSGLCPLVPAVTHVPTSQVLLHHLPLSSSLHWHPGRCGSQAMQDHDVIDCWLLRERHSMCEVDSKDVHFGRTFVPTLPVTCTAPLSSLGPGQTLHQLSFEFQARTSSTRSNNTRQRSRQSTRTKRLFSCSLLCSIRLAIQTDLSLSVSVRGARDRRCPFSVLASVACEIRTRC